MIRETPPALMLQFSQFAQRLQPVIVALLLVGCTTVTNPESSSSAPDNAAPKPNTTEPPKAIKVIDPIPPIQIGDKSPIAFTHWKGIRKGTGNLIQAGKTTKLQFIDLELNPDDTMTLAYREKAENTIRGTWRRTDNKTVDLNIPNTATGTLLFMDRANPYQLSLKGKDFTLEFRVQE